MENSTSKSTQISTNYAAILKFVLLSSLGVFLFMVPLSKDGQVIIPVATLSNTLRDSLGASLQYIITAIIVITAVSTIITKAFKPKFIMENKFLNSLFNVSTIWFIVRIMGGIFIICTMFQIGPEAIWSGNTGGMVLNDLLPILFSVFLFAGLLLPLLLSFGLLEFVGSLLVKVMRPIFNLPGASAIDCIASWLGDGTIGVLLTSKQYEDGYYTEREACVIGTTFSLVSITFSLVVCDTVGLGHMFVPFYLVVTAAGLIAAVLIPKLPPLSKKRDVFHNGIDNTTSSDLPEGYTPFKYGLKNALEKANESTIVNDVVVKGTLNVIDMWFGVIPVVMAVGTFALIIAEYTPLFQILGTPFIPLLKILQVPEAAAASSTLVAGFADMLLPSIMAGGIQSEMTRFIIAATSVTQLIYLSEVGALLLGSKIPINFKELFIIFLERTLITLPIITLIAHLLF
ncbi:YjiH family protein [Clostridium culturomicium]|uniref:YjiH family protein n=1 Tax=Clostridium culturomicium TaxID=1499683 RepID=UPI0005A7C111|nr:YjiH family protein [Clostridium culturomicium]